MKLVIGMAVPKAQKLHDIARMGQYAGKTSYGKTTQVALSLHTCTILRDSIMQERRCRVGVTCANFL